MPPVLRLSVALLGLGLGLAAPARAQDAAAPCLREPVRVTRAHARPAEEAQLALTHCDGRPNLAALDALSLLARASGVDRPAELEGGEHDEVAPGVKRLDPGLLTRLQALADRFPGRAFAIVSGHRPRARRTSRHRTGMALDVEVEGVDRREVAELARAELPATGVGYYPNSTFTHIDVRDRSYAWMDLSSPGRSQRRRPWPLEAPDGEPADAVATTAPTPAPPSDAPLPPTPAPPPEPASAPAASTAPRSLEDLLAEARTVASELSHAMARLTPKR